MKRKVSLYCFSFYASVSHPSQFCHIFRNSSFASVLGPEEAVERGQYGFMSLILQEPMGLC